MKKILVFGLVFLFLFACGRNQNYNEECGDLVEFQIDDEYCEKYGLRRENFTLKYPEGLDVETQADYPSKNYASFLKYDKDTVLVESANIGYFYGLKESGNDGIGSFFGLTKESLMTSMLNQYSAQGVDIEKVTMQDETIRGEEHFTVRGTLTANLEEISLVGNYLIQIVMIATEADHGVLLVMLARDDSEIESYEDFETKGCTSPILQTLEGT
ncbi:MAG: hypothetical protein AAFQ20_04295 [Bacteroidota bacterium]